MQQFFFFRIYVGALTLLCENSIQFVVELFKKREDLISDAIFYFLSFLVFYLHERFVIL